jgi:hypothetical protein
LPLQAGNEGGDSFLSPLTPGEVLSLLALCQYVFISSLKLKAKEASSSSQPIIDSRYEYLLTHSDDLINVYVKVIL